MARGGDELGEGLRRTWLASERTYLAWLRTGFASFAVSIGVGKVVPALTGGGQWPYAGLGVVFVLLRIGLLVVGALLHIFDGMAIRRGGFVEAGRGGVGALSLTSI